MEYLGANRLGFMSFGSLIPYFWYNYFTMCPRASLYYFLILCALLSGPLGKRAFAQKHSGAPSDPFLEGLLKKYPAFFDQILSNRDSLKVQIIYTEVHRDKKNKPRFIDHTFHVDEQKYFYPASTVKMPVALLSLQRLGELGLDRKATMITGSGYRHQTAVLNDPNSSDGRPQIEQYIKKIFLVSDNDAFNRLYEFLGPGYIHEQLSRMGYPEAEVIHRLETALSMSGLGNAQIDWRQLACIAKGKRVGDHHSHGDGFHRADVAQSAADLEHDQSNRGVRNRRRSNLRSRNRRSRHHGLLSSHQLQHRFPTRGSAGVSRCRNQRAGYWHAELDDGLCGQFRLS